LTKALDRTSYGKNAEKYVDVLKYYFSCHVRILKAMYPSQFLLAASIQCLGDTIY